jgi:hypothetical protein
MHSPHKKVMYMASLNLQSSNQMGAILLIPNQGSSKRKQESPKE